MKKIISKLILLTPILAVMMLTPAFADILHVDEYQITSSSAIETTPTIGNDGFNDLVVFTVTPLIFGEPGPSDIWYQPLVEGAPSGFPIQVTSAATDDRLNDVWGDYIVYTAYDSVSSSTGSIMLYQISTRDLQPISSVMTIHEPRIHDNYVVWREGDTDSAQVMLYNLSWLGTATDAVVIAGPVPPTFDAQIGDRFVVWAERNDGQYDTIAHDLSDSMTFAVTVTAGVDETRPSTSGAWVVWESQVHDESTTTIEAVNLDTADFRVIADNGAVNRNPSIDGDLVTWESDVNGNMDVFVYRISTGETFQVTTDPSDQYLNDVFGNLVAYKDTRGFSEDIYVSCLTFVPEGYAGVWYVKTDGSDSNTGISWNDAFQTIQKAIDSAIGGDEIWVKEGTHYLSSQTDLYKAVAIYGGFAGMETARDHRDFKNNVTIFDGQGSIEHCFYVTAGATIDGVTITGGEAVAVPPLEPSEGRGGGIYNEGDLTIINCTVSNNWANYSGGGMYNADGSSATISNCTFSDNVGDNGGGGGICNSGSSVTITNCTFSNNSVPGEVGGGGMYSSYSSGIVTNCAFNGNSASLGGGIFNSWESDLTITNCIFSGNSAEAGGGMYIGDSSPTITNCTFFGNVAEGWGAGGISNDWSSPVITNCILWGDTAPSYPEIYNYNSSPTVTYCNIDQDGYAGSNGNIRIDPDFVDPDNDDFHLTSDSPCIDAGTNGAPALPDTDFEGDPRKMDGNNDDIPCVDMGADEYGLDDDGDGLFNEEEMGPDGDNPNYDGNGDFLPDCQQSNVASLHTCDRQSYITLASPYETSLTNVQAVPNPSPTDTPAGADFPYGFFEFTVNDVGAGGSTTVTFYLPGAAPNTYFKYGPTPVETTDHWYEFIFDDQTQTGAALIGDITILHFVDGQRGDDDLDGTNGTIVEPGGPGLLIFMPVAVDIKPQSCPNPLNVKSKGVLPVAILGTEYFDASQIDAASVSLEGVTSLRSNLEDVATPFEPFTGKEDCYECTNDGPDGYVDLTLKFDTQQVVAAIEPVTDGQCVVLKLTGNLVDGTPITGEDVVRILKKGKKGGK